jgi:hypothetical protein
MALLGVHRVRRHSLQPDDFSTQSWFLSSETFVKRPSFSNFYACPVSLEDRTGVIKIFAFLEHKQKKAFSKDLFFDGLFGFRFFRDRYYLYN